MVHHTGLGAHAHGHSPTGGSTTGGLNLTPASAAGFLPLPLRMTPDANGNGHMTSAPSDPALAMATAAMMHARMRLPLALTKKHMTKTEVTHPGLQQHAGDHVNNNSNNTDRLSPHGDDKEGKKTATRGLTYFYSVVILKLLI